MAHSKSAKKRVRQNEEQRLRNRHHRSRLRSAIKKLRAAVAAGDQDASKEQLPRTIALLDRMAGRRVIHRNAAARTKSRLSRLVARSDAPAWNAGFSRHSPPQAGGGMDSSCREGTYGLERRL